MDGQSQDERYTRAAAEYGPALERLARAYEADADQRRDLLQEVHLALWRSFALFDGRCALRTWVYRVGHNAAASHVAARRRARAGAMVALEDLELSDDDAGPERALGEQQALARLMAMIRALKPPDAQVMLLYLEDMDAAAIGEITGISAGAIATKIHRIKALLAKRFHDQGGNT
ncbi:MAG TPA: sigma-70 family RNA polymerase sigma factor [Rhizomicrobium sp.]|jgi:RNA polymerase sigma-70 factor (ECF subfamily)|nr:sigma-70 family RNA polymerase sigma factor [Rhizomicrobium sp.]